MVSRLTDVSAATVMSSKHRFVGIQSKMQCANCPRLDEKDKQLSEDSAKAAGYIDETSWDLFFFPDMMQATQTGEE